VLLICSTAGAMLNVNVEVLVCVGLPASETWNVIVVFETIVVGVPAMTPLEAFSVSPAGKAPAETVQVYGVVPPEAASALEYAAPTCPSGIQPVDSFKVAGVIVSTRVAVLVCTGLAESVTLKVSEAPDTGTVGVPLMTAVEAFSDSPAGNVPARERPGIRSGPPEAVSVARYEAPAWPLGSELDVMLRLVALLAGNVASAPRNRQRLPPAAGVGDANCAAAYCCFCL